MLEPAYEITVHRYIFAILLYFSTCVRIIAPLSAFDGARSTSSGLSSCALVKKAVYLCKPAHSTIGSSVSTMRRLEVVTATAGVVLPNNGQPSTILASLTGLKDAYQPWKSAVKANLQCSIL